MSDPEHTPISTPTHYTGHAAGWGAMKSCARYLMDTHAPLATMKALKQLNRPDGIDCPGCAWPDPADASMLEFCENGVKHVAAETTTGRVGAAFFAGHTVTELRTRSDRWLEEQGRLAEPLRYNAETDRYEAVSWDAAYARIGEVLRGLDSPDRAEFYTSGRASNEAAFLYQLFGRAFGTNNFPDCSNMCHESSGVALTEAIGIGKGTVTLEDFEKADAIFVFGQNPGSNHPRMLTSLQAAARRGCQIVGINPLVEVGLKRFLHPQHVGKMLANSATTISSLYLQPLIGGDLAVIKGLCKWIFAAESEAPGTVLDRDFIEAHTTGFDGLQADIEGTSWEEIEREAGLSRGELKAAAEVYLKADAVICCWAMGLTQNKHAVPTIQHVVNLLLLRGHIGRPGAGACPVRGHSNVQGDRTVGINHHCPEPLAQAMEREFGITVPRTGGHDTVQAIQAMRDGEATVFVGLGGNFVRATPDTALTDQALRRCALTVQIATKLNHSHLAHGKEAYILPCLGRTEIDVQAGGPQYLTVEDSMSMVHRSAGRLPPATPQLRSEPAIVAGIAAATLGTDPIDWPAYAADYSRIRDRIAACIPAFADYNRRIEAPGGFYLGNSAADRQWATPDGRAHFTVAPIPALALPPGQLRMMTTRTHDQYNTTVYSDDDRYRGISGNRRVVFMNPNDISARGLLGGELVDITSHFAGADLHGPGFTVVPYDIPAGCCATYFPEANCLVPLDSVADKSNTPTSKYIAVSVTRADG